MSKLVIAAAFFLAASSAGTAIIDATVAAGATCERRALSINCEMTW